jgi:hypothetical protein
MSIAVEITQFHRPNGRTTLEFTDLPNDCAVGYEAMKRHGCRLTAEEIYGNISVCIEHPEGDYDIEVVANGPKVQEALADMLRRFDGGSFQKWLKGQSH